MGYLFSLLSLSKTATEKGLNVSEVLLLVCGLVLAVGAAGEYLEEHGRLPRWMEWSEHPKLVFVWMVAISLIGEFVGDAGVFVFSGHLQAISDSESASLNKEAGIARRDASNANALAKQYQSRIAASEAQVATAMAASDDAVARVKTADARIAEAQRGAAEARAQVAVAVAESAKANLELAKIRTPRSIPREKEPELSATLKVFSGQEFALYTFSDEESINLANSIERILTSAGLILREATEGDIRLGKYGITSLSGVRIHIPVSRTTPSTPLRSSAERFVAIALKPYGIDSVLNANPSLDKTPNMMNIIIGKKP